MNRKKNEKLIYILKKNRSSVSKSFTRSCWYHCSTHCCSSFQLRSSNICFKYILCTHILDMSFDWWDYFVVQYSYGYIERVIIELRIKSNISLATWYKLIKLPYLNFFLIVNILKATKMNNSQYFACGFKAYESC